VGQLLRYMRPVGSPGCVCSSATSPRLIESLVEFYPTASWQRCAVHFYRNVWTAVPTTKVREWRRCSKRSTRRRMGRPPGKAVLVVAKLREMKLAKAAEIVAPESRKPIQYFQFPPEHCAGLRTNNPLERLMREIRAPHPRGRRLSRWQQRPHPGVRRLRHVVGTQWAANATSTWAAEDLALATPATARSWRAIRMKALRQIVAGAERSATPPRSCTRRVSAAQYRSRKISYRAKARSAGARLQLRSTYSCSCARARPRVLQRFSSARSSRFSVSHSTGATRPIEIILPSWPNPLPCPANAQLHSRTWRGQRCFAPAFPHAPFHPRSF